MDMNTSMNVIALNMKLCIRSFVNIFFCLRTSTYTMTQNWF